MDSKSQHSARQGSLSCSSLFCCESRIQQWRLELDQYYWGQVALQAWAARPLGPPLLVRPWVLCGLAGFQVPTGMEAACCWAPAARTSGPPLKGRVHGWPLGTPRSMCSNRKCADKGGNPRRWQRARARCEPSRSTQQRKKPTTQHNSNRSIGSGYHCTWSFSFHRVKKKRTRGRQGKLCYISEGSSIPSEVKLLYTL